ncbi:hypothetical protein FLL83_13650 [Vibrio cholerae]|nr:hypothetical protein FLM04_11785 [Vibrio cholerae]TQP73011.1 hypothetical protein FLL75_14590 [Vibrio cholerae]TQQ61469.1 hypothetical protein FLL83_13650 [Vibrio cholerae]
MLQRFIKKLDRSWLAVLCMLTSVTQRKRRKAHQSLSVSSGKSGSVTIGTKLCNRLIHGMGLA